MSETVKINVFKRVLVAISAVFLASVGVTTAAFNDHPLDFPTLQVNNDNIHPSSKNWSTAVSASPGDQISFLVYYHNNSTETAKNVLLRLTPQSSASKATHSFTATILSDNKPSVTGSATVSLSTTKPMTYIPGSIRWFPNQCTVESCTQSFPNNQSGTEIFGAGVLLGDIAPGFSAQGSVRLFYVVEAEHVSPPTVSLTADRTQITPGEGAKLSWVSSNASTCSASNGWFGTKPTFGSQIVKPHFTTTYTITCFSSSEESASDSITISVQSVPFPSVTISANPSIIKRGDSSILSWNSANADFCTASQGWSGDRPLSGSVTVSPLQNTTYRITCHNARGEDSDTVSIKVIDEPPPTVNLIASPTSLLHGNSALLSWSSSNANHCIASRGWSGNKPLSGSQTVTPGVTTSYTLTCFNSQGDEASDTETIIVNQVSSNVSVSITANPAIVVRGHTSTLHWSSSNAISCIASNGWSGSKQLSGSQIVAPANTTTYTITCSGLNGDFSSDSATVSVISAPTVQLPTLVFYANPSIITSGDSSILTWQSDNTTSCIAGGGWSGNKTLNGSQSVSPLTQTNYTMTCLGPGGSVFAQALITVLNPETAPESLSVVCGVSGKSAEVGETVAFSSSARGGRAPYSYVWSGAFSKAAVSHVLTFSTTGTKTAVVKVTDVDGKTAQTACSINITPRTSLPPPPPPTPPGEVLPAAVSCEIKTVAMCTDGKLYEVDVNGNVYDKSGRLIYSSKSTSTNDGDVIIATSVPDSEDEQRFTSLFLKENGKLSGIGLLLLWYFLTLLAVGFGILIYRLLRRGTVSNF